MAWPEPSLNDHDAPWNLDQDEETGEWVCSCTSCKRKRREEDVDDYEYHYRKDDN